jgi:hypothetical protein
MGKREMRRELKAIRVRFKEIKDSKKPEDKAEVVQLMRQHEHLRMVLIDVGDPYP